MATHGKKYREKKALVDRTKKYTLDEALALLKQLPFAKFDETVDLVIRLGVDPRKSEEMVRGAVKLPNGTGKTVRVVVFAAGEKEKEALAAGADFVGTDELVEKIKGGWLDFDAAIATPDLMREVGKLGRVLGPRGLMPNPKVGTVTFDVAQAVAELKAGRVEYRVDKAANVHAGVGRISFTEQKLKENIMALVDALNKAKPSTAKGSYFKSWAVSTTMGPGIKMDPLSIIEMLREKS